MDFGGEGEVGRSEGELGFLFLCPFIPGLFTIATTVEHTHRVLDRDLFKEPLLATVVVF